MNSKPLRNKMQLSLLLLW